MHIAPIAFGKVNSKMYYLWFINCDWNMQTGSLWTWAFTFVHNAAWAFGCQIICVYWITNDTLKWGRLSTEWVVAAQFCWYVHINMSVRSHNRMQTIFGNSNHILTENRKVKNCNHLVFTNNDKWLSVQKINNDLLSYYTIRYWIQHLKMLLFLT